MAMFVHLALESRIKAIQRSGIRLARRPAPYPPGVFAMPVTRNFYVSHQWLRELRRRNQGPLVGVYFRIADSELVTVGHYGKQPERMTAAEATAVIMSCQAAEGYEIIVLRSIAPTEIHRVRRLPQVIGWRYHPGSHGKRPCGCPYCQRGQYGARKLRDQYEKA